MQYLYWKWWQLRSSSPRLGHVGTALSLDYSIRAASHPSLHQDSNPRDNADEYAFIVSSSLRRCVGVSWSMEINLFCAWL